MHRPHIDHHEGDSSHIIGGRKDDVKTIAKATQEPITSGKDFLRRQPLRSIFPEKRTKILHVNKEDPIPKAFKILADNKILSVPVWDSDQKQFLSFLDMLDIVFHVISTAKESELTGGGMFAQLIESSDKFSSKTCGEIAGASGRNPFYPLDENAPLLTALKFMVDHKVHRIPVVDSTGDLVSLVTQSQVISMIIKHLKHFPDVTKHTVSELHMGLKHVLSISKDQTAYEAFKLIHDKKVSGVAVLDEKGICVGNISASDIRHIGVGAEMISRLFIPSDQYLKLIPLDSGNVSGPYVATPQSTFEEALKKLASTKAHRIYVVDSEHKPIGVISLVDVLEALLKSLN